MPRSVWSGCLLFLAATLLPGCGSKAKNEAGSDSSKKVEVTQGGPSVPAPERRKKSRPMKANKTTRTGDGSDPDLMDMEDRYKALVNRIRPGMTKEQVEAVLGTPDEMDEQDLGQFNPQKAGQTLDIWKWTDILDEKKFIMLSFVNGKLRDGGTPGYDIRKGVESK